MARLSSVVLVTVSLVQTAIAGPFQFTTGDPDGKMATASRPSAGGFEIESADDFVLSQRTLINSATFTGLIPLNLQASDINQVVVEIYRVFPLDSDTVRTIGVPTRANSPSDAAFASRDSAASELTFTTNKLNDSFTVLNSVQPGGIHAIPLQTTGGDGGVTGQEFSIGVKFATPFDLSAGHYFFVPQVALSSGDFLWLSAPKPIVAPGTPFLPDLQSWTRDEFLAPDWLRVGTDIVGSPSGSPFNAAFSLDGLIVPEPGSLMVWGLGLAGIVALMAGAVPARQPGATERI